MAESLLDRIRKQAGQTRSDGSGLKPRSDTRPQSIREVVESRGNLSGDTPTTSLTPRVSAQYQPSAAEQARRQLQFEQDQAEKQRKRGRAATLLTGNVGLLTDANVSRRSLMGY